MQYLEHAGGFVLDSQSERVQRVSSASCKAPLDSVRSEQQATSLQHVEYALEEGASPRVATYRMAGSLSQQPQPAGFYGSMRHHWTGDRARLLWQQHDHLDLAL